MSLFESIIFACAIIIVSQLAIIINQNSQAALEAHLYDDLEGYEVPFKSKSKKSKKKKTKKPTNKATIPEQTPTAPIPWRIGTPRTCCGSLGHRHKADCPNFH